MITKRTSAERGYFDFEWLKTYHTFSFGDYHDPNHHNFRTLRVINEDWVQAGKGFPPHGHRDMEIITYVIEGALAHKDSMGNGSTILPGDVQYMSAGLGVEHSEFNHSKTETTHLLQIWIMTNLKGAKPLYGQKTFKKEEKQGKLCLLVSGTGEKDSIRIRQDAKIYASILKTNEKLTTALGKERYGWIQIVQGTIDLNGVVLKAGDGASLSEEYELSFEGKDKLNEFLFFDLN